MIRAWRLELPLGKKNRQEKLYRNGRPTLRVIAARTVSPAISLCISGKLTVASLICAKREIPVLLK
jgi:hypothetical protein